MAKEHLSIIISIIALIVTFFTLQPDELVNNILSWKVLFFILAIIAVTASLTLFAYKRFFSDGYIMTFKSRTNIKLKKLLDKELQTTKSIIAIGIACDDLSKKPYEFWKRLLIESDGKLKMMFADPNGVQIGLREELVCGNNNGEFAQSISYNLRILGEYFDRLKKHQTNNEIRAEIKLYDFAPVLNCIITDNYVIFHHYGSSERGIEMPTYVIKKGSDSIDNQIYSFYNSMLNELWVKSKDI